MLTEKKLEKLIPPLKGNRLYPDRVIPGLSARVTSNNVKAFTLDYRVGKRQHRFTIGRWPTTTVRDARIEANRLLAEIAKGNDPMSKRIASRTAPSMKELEKDYFERHALPHKRASSIRGDRHLFKIVMKRLGHLQVNAVTSQDIEGLHSGLSAKPYAANRTLSLLTKAFNLAMAWGWITKNPCKNEAIERYKEHVRTRWLDESELTRLNQALDAYPRQDKANAVRLLLLTGCRTSELLNAIWWNVDLDREALSLPSHSTKQDENEVFPLNERALAILKTMKAASSGGPRALLFPGRKTGKHLSIRRTWEAMCKAAGITGARIHDTRHSFASHLVNKGVSLAIIGSLMGHKKSSTTMKYAHISDKAKREATAVMGTVMGNAKTA